MALLCVFVSVGAENNSPLGVAIFNVSGPAFHQWKGVELAVSIFWPNFYQVSTHDHLFASGCREGGGNTIKKRKTDRFKSDRQKDKG